jgi:predicted O-methyltransferase YrrM
MNALLQEILETKTVSTADGRTLPLISSIDAGEARFLDALVREVRPNVTLEVGLAYGCSALAILNASPSGSRHIAIDPHQHGIGDDWKGMSLTAEQRSGWRGIGMANLDRAGFGDRVELIEETSHQALSILERRGERVDFAFIDGWHTFDHALVDFFGVDLILNVGGIVAIDDANTYPAVHKLCRFIASNRSYKPIGDPRPGDARPSWRRKLLANADRTFGLGRLLRPEVTMPDHALGLSLSSCIAFRKIGEDQRRWDHFVEF